MEDEKGGLEKRDASIEGMVAHLIVDQQAMVTSFNTRGGRHSGQQLHLRKYISCVNNQARNTKIRDKLWNYICGIGLLGEI